MKALTVQQPWASIIAAGSKLVENRTWATRYRGTVAIHAGARWSPRGATDPRFTAWANERGYADSYPRGIIATAELEDCHPDQGCCEPWGESSYVEQGGRLRTVVYHWCIDGVIPLAEPVACAGRLGLWNVPPGPYEQVMAQLLYPPMDVPR